MSTFMKIMLVPALIVAFSVGVALAAGGGGESGSPLAQVAPTTSTVEDVTTTEAEDVSGPCDEAEHADDPRCTGAAPADDRGRDDDGPGDDDGRDDDNSGPGSQSSGPSHDDDDDDHGDDDRHDDDSSGHGRGGDDR